MENGFQLNQIAVFHSCYKEKFGTPRQPGLVKGAPGVVKLLPPYNIKESVTGLEGFSHLWLIFIFDQCVSHKSQGDTWSPTVRPPRLGGNKRVGVFASRSNFRPNPIGISVVEIESVEFDGSEIFINVAGADLIDGTPIVDIKPYIPYADAIVNADGGYASFSPEIKLEVVFSDSVLQVIQSIENSANIVDVIKSVIAFDPRPQYKGNNESEKVYAMKIYDFDIKWRVKDGIATISAIDMIE